MAPLNQAAGNLTAVPECANVLPDGTLRPKPAGPTNMFVAAQPPQQGPNVGTGITLFQCCIHPWMHMQVERR